jgi:tagaturonate reductase
VTDALPTLARALLASNATAIPSSVQLPTAAMLALPERAVQFGTGALLRGLVDFFIDEANARGQFNGRVVAIGSTGSGRDRVFDAQDGLYTLVARGLIHGTPTQEIRVIGSVSRALSAADDWDAVLACARQPDLGVIFSNTTEVGIAIDAGDVPDDGAPRSFPAKLTRFLYERARAFDYDPARGVVVVPCELLENNGAQLRALVTTLADRWSLDARFTSWLDACVPFANTLVDRIVPGAPTRDDSARLTAILGYDDALLTTAEHFRQLVIEGDDALAARLGFCDADAGIIVGRDVEPYRQRKVGLLNGTHTLAVTTALLCGCSTVRDAMTHHLVGPFIRRAILQDIVPALTVPEALPFAESVLQRFANPYIQHALVDITLQGTTKFRVRLVPTMVQAAAMHGRVPATLVFGFAAHLLYLRGDLQQARRAAGLNVPPDAMGAQVEALWREIAPVAGTPALRMFVDRVLHTEALWGPHLATVPAFAESVLVQLDRLMTVGADAALHTLLTTGET